ETTDRTAASRAVRCRVYADRRGLAHTRYVSDVPSVAGRARSAEDQTARGDGSRSHPARSCNAGCLVASGGPHALAGQIHGHNGVVLPMNRRDVRESGGVATMPVTDRHPPYAPEAEIAVLGGMLIDPDAVTKAIEIVDDSMFYREANRRIFRAMARLFQQGQVVDPVTVSEELKQSDELEAAGGMAYLAELLDAVPTAANLEYHARIVRERALLRRLIDASSQIIRDSYEIGDRTVEQVLDEAEQRIFQVAQSHEREGFVWIKKILYPTFERIEQLQAAQGGITGVPSGFHDLDEMTGGFQAGDLVILAARPSMGKTSIVVGMALHAAIAKQIPVAIFSLEMSKEQIVQ